MLTPVQVAPNVNVASEIPYSLPGVKCSTFCVAATAAVTSANAVAYVCQVSPLLSDTNKFAVSVVGGDTTPSALTRRVMSSPPPAGANVKNPPCGNVFGAPLTAASAVGVTSKRSPRKIKLGVSVDAVASGILEFLAYEACGMVGAILYPFSTPPAVWYRSGLSVLVDNISS